MNFLSSETAKRRNDDNSDDNPYYSGARIVPPRDDGLSMMRVMKSRITRQDLRHSFFGSGKVTSDNRKYENKIFRRMKNHGFLKHANKKVKAASNHGNLSSATRFQRLHIQAGVTLYCNASFCLCACACLVRVSVCLYSAVFVRLCDCSTVRGARLVGS